MGADASDFLGALGGGYGRVGKRAKDNEVSPFNRTERQESMELGKRLTVDDTHGIPENGSDHVFSTAGIQGIQAFAQHGSGIDLVT